MILKDRGRKKIKTVMVSTTYGKVKLLRLAAAVAAALGKKEEMGTVLFFPNSPAR